MKNLLLALKLTFVSLAIINSRSEWFHFSTSQELLLIRTKTFSVDHYKFFMIKFDYNFVNRKINKIIFLRKFFSYDYWSPKLTK